MFDRLLALLFPDRCLVCDELMRHREDDCYICPSCTQRLSQLFAENTCPLCGRSMAPEEEFCNICLTHSRHFDLAVSCFSYEKEIRHAVLQYKFGGRKDHCRSLSCLLYRRVLPLHQKQAFDCIVYPPMTKAAYNERGYNQSGLLAKRISKKLNIPCLDKAIIKIKETPKQSTLSYEERVKNVSKAFALNMARDVFSGKRILLIDDVLTTGATADELSKLLKSAKAKEVIVASIATVKQKEAYEFLPQDELTVTF